MWQTKYASAVHKNLGLGLNFRPCSEGYFLSGRPQSVSRDKSSLPIFSAGPVISWSIVVRRSFATANNDFRYNLMKVNKDSEAQPVERNITTQTTILAFLTIYSGSGRRPVGRAFTGRLSVFQGLCQQGFLGTRMPTALCFLVFRRQI